MISRETFKILKPLRFMIHSHLAKECSLNRNYILLNQIYMFWDKIQKEIWQINQNMTFRETFKILKPLRFMIQSHLVKICNPSKYHIVLNQMDMFLDKIQKEIWQINQNMTFRETFKILKPIWFMIQSSFIKICNHSKYHMVLNQMDMF
jgi:hypothetical protein